MRLHKKTRQERWLKTRKKGFLYFIVVKSLLGWGVTSAVVLLLAAYFIFNTPVTNFAGVITLLVYLLISVLRGCVKWYMMERQYGKDAN